MAVECERHYVVMFASSRRQGPVDVVWQVVRQHFRADQNFAEVLGFRPVRLVEWNPTATSVDDKTSLESFLKEAEFLGMVLAYYRR